MYVCMCVCVCVCMRVSERSPCIVVQRRLWNVPGRKSVLVSHDFGKSMFTFSICAHISADSLNVS